MSDTINTNVTSVELDTVLDESYEAWVIRLLAQGVQTTMLQVNGPAGGNPVVRYTGEPEALKRMMVENFEMSAEEAEAELN